MNATPDTPAAQAHASPLSDAPPVSIPCPACDYPIALGASRCAECGYACSADEWAQAIRRSVFLEINRGAWIGPIVVCGLASLLTPFFVTLAFLVLYLFVTPAIGAKFAGLYRRILRQIWLVSLPWLLIPWMVVLPAFTIIPEWVFGWRYVGTDVPNFLRLSGRGAFGGVLLPLGVLSFNMLCWIIWRWRWRALCRAASLPAHMQRSGPVRLAVRLAYIPAILLAGAVLVFFGTMNVLDAIIPGWDR